MQFCILCWAICLNALAGSRKSVLRSGGGGGFTNFRAAQLIQKGHQRDMFFNVAPLIAKDVRSEKQPWTNPVIESRPNHDLRPRTIAQMKCARMSLLCLLVRDDVADQNAKHKKTSQLCKEPKRQRLMLCKEKVGWLCGIEVADNINCLNKFSGTGTVCGRQCSNVIAACVLQGHYWGAAGCDCKHAYMSDWRSTVQHLKVEINFLAVYKMV